jgi:hypothetical protein
MSAPMVRACVGPLTYLAGGSKSKAFQGWFWSKDLLNQMIRRYTRGLNLILCLGLLVLKDRISLNMHDGRSVGCVSRRDFDLALLCLTLSLTSTELLPIY